LFERKIKHNSYYFNKRAAGRQTLVCRRGSSWSRVAGFIRPILRNRQSWSFPRIR